MSTILNTLKKLEEEKSVLDRSLNLKGLVLQTDRTAYPRQEKPQGSNARGLIALIVAGVVVGCGLGVYFNPTDKAVAKSANAAKQEVSSPVPKTNAPVAETLPADPASAVPASAPLEAAPTSQPATQGQTAQKEVATGIPLSSIQGTEKIFSPLPAAEPPKPSTAGSAPQPPVQVAKANPVPVVPIRKKAASQSPSTAKDSPFEDPVDDNKPESDIISMEILPEAYEIDSGIVGAKVRKLQTAQPASEPKEHVNYSGMSVQGLKMKGIIYFSANNPANYILVTGAKDANQKMKIGDVFQDATLKEVYPDRAVFTYKGEMTQLRIGE